MTGELHRCDFCMKEKQVQRFYVRVQHKHFDDNKQGTFTRHFKYCRDCGIEPPVMAQGKEMKKKIIKVKGIKEANVLIEEGYKILSTHQEEYNRLFPVMVDCFIMVKPEALAKDK